MIHYLKFESEINQHSFKKYSNKFKRKLYRIYVKYCTKNLIMFYS